MKKPTMSPSSKTLNLIQECVPRLTKSELHLNIIYCETLITLSTRHIMTEIERHLSITNTTPCLQLTKSFDGDIKVFVVLRQLNTWMVRLFTSNLTLMVALVSTHVPNCSFNLQLIGEEHLNIVQYTS